MTPINSHIDRAIRTLINDEGYSPKLYRCPAGKQTIGFGFNVDASEFPYGIALSLLKYQVEELDRILAEKVGFYNNLDDSCKMVLINMAFCHGVRGLLNYKKMLAALEQEDYDLASRELLDSEFAKKDTKRALKLAVTVKEVRYKEKPCQTRTIQ